MHPIRQIYITALEQYNNHKPLYLQDKQVRNLRYIFAPIQPIEA